MKIIKRFDYFRKPKEDLEKSTCCGSILSFLTLFLIVYLSFEEFYVHKTPLLSRKIVIQSGVKDANYIYVNIDIVFPHMQCLALTMAKEGPSNSETLSRGSGIVFERLSSDNLPLPYDLINEVLPEQYKNESLELQKIVTGIIGEEQCHIKGEIKVEKTPGRIIFDHKLKKDYLIAIHDIDRDLLDKINLSHHINKFIFGDDTEMSSEADSATREIELDTLKGVNLSHSHPVTCTYYLKAIPISMFAKKEIDQNYQYSYHANCEVILFVHNAK